MSGSAMYCLKLQCVHFLEFSGCQLMKYPVTLLHIRGCLNSHSHKLSTHKFQQCFNLAHEKSQIKNVNFENNKAGLFSEVDTMLLNLHEETQNTKGHTANSFRKVKSCCLWNIHGFTFGVPARKCATETVAQLLYIPPPSLSFSYCLRNFSILCSERTHKNLCLEGSCKVSSGGVHNLSFGNSITMKSAVKFYNDQTQVTQKRIKGRKASDDYHSGSEDEASSMLTNASMTEHHINYENRDTGLESIDASDNEADSDITVQRKPADEMTLPELSRVSFNIVPYVKRSRTLKNLVMLGVSLDKIQKVAGIAEHLIKSDFNRDIVPYLKLLVQAGVQPNMIGRIFSGNPLLFKESIPDLELRIGYLLHKDFTLKEIAAIVTSAPITLLMNPVMLDDKLGFLQKVFDLTDLQVREVVKLFPKILPYKKQLIADTRFHLKEFVGFDDSEMKQIILKDPRIFTVDQEDLVEKFDYLHNYMQLSHQQILVWPKVMRMKLYIIKNRHLFLLSLGRAQYDPHKENYVCMEALTSMDDEFCKNVAKCSVNDFYNFCKTL